MSSDRLEFLQYDSMSQPWLIKNHYVNSGSGMERQDLFKKRLFAVCGAVTLLFTSSSAATDTQVKNDFLGSK